MQFREVIIMTRIYLHTYAGAHESQRGTERRRTRPTTVCGRKKRAEHTQAVRKICHRMRARLGRCGGRATCTMCVLARSTTRQRRVTRWTAGVRSSMVLVRGVLGSSVWAPAGYLGGRARRPRSLGAEQTIIQCDATEASAGVLRGKRCVDPSTGPEPDTTASPVDGALDRALALRRGEVRDRAADTRHSGVPADGGIGDESWGLRLAVCGCCTREGRDG